MSVVGLDTDSYGFHAVLFGKDTPVPWLTFRSRASDVETRRVELCAEGRDFFGGLPPGSWVFAEEPLSLRNGKTSRVLALAAGALWAQALGCDLFWAWTDTATWKKAVVGSGAATKQHVADWVRHGPRLPAPESRLAAYEATPDLFDAHCLAVYGVRALAR